MTHHRIVIVGTGFSGLGMGIKLRQEGELDFVLLERADDIGGTWRDNTYRVRAGAASGGGVVAGLRRR